MQETKILREVEILKVLEELQKSIKDASGCIPLSNLAELPLYILLDTLVRNNVASSFKYTGTRESPE